MTTPLLDLKAELNSFKKQILSDGIQPPGMVKAAFYCAKEYVLEGYYDEALSEVLAAFSWPCFNETVQLQSRSDKAFGEDIGLVMGSLKEKYGYFMINGVKNV